MKVVLTAPIPGVRTPNLPFAGAMLTGLRIQFSLCTLDLREMIRRDILSGATMQTKTSMMREGRAICKSVCRVPTRADFLRKE
jgi:hypothetical protein